MKSKVTQKKPAHIPKKQNSSNDSKSVNKSDKFILSIKDNKWLILILTITLIFYFRTFYFDFVYWDDDTYILNNPYIKTLSLTQIKNIFTNIYFANYHPFTTLTYLLEFYFFNVNAGNYHILNVIIHLINTILVFIFIKKISSGKEIPLITAFIFALHPMHVESVAWISERKDVLYTMFFLLSLIFYIKFLHDKYKLRYYIASFILFLASLLSKSSAVVLPLLILLCIYFLNKKIRLKDVFYCVPFFILSLAFGVIALFSQKVAMGTEKLDLMYNFYEKILLVIYTIYFYLIRFIFPYRFSAYHPYPEISDNGLPYEFILSPIIIILIIIFIFKLKHEWRHIIVFGLLFFLFAIILVIQIIPIGDAIVSERYTYLAYIGLGFIFGNIIKEYKKYLYIKLIGFFFLVFVLISTYKQIEVWQNSNTLWNKVLEVYPNSYLAYNNRGNAKADQGNYNEALIDFNKSISKNAEYAMAYSNRARVLKEMNNLQGALKDYNKSIELDKKIPESYNGRGVILASEGKFEEALKDLDKAIELKPDYSIAYNNRAGIKSELNDMEGALLDYDKAITLDPFYADAVCNKGAVLLKKGEINKAISYFNKAIGLNPEYAKAFENLAILNYNQKDYIQSLKLFEKLTSLQPDYAQAFYFKGSVKLLLNDTAGACTDWQKALSLGYSDSQMALDAICK